MWKADPLLEAAVLPAPLDIFGPIGANGIAFDEEQENLFVVNTGKQLIARVDVRSDGTAGGVHLFSQDPRVFGADGCTFHDGNLYVAVNAQDSVVRVSENGRVSTVAQGGLLQNPTEVRFGRGEGTRTLYITNFALFRFAGVAPGPAKPALLSLDVGDDEDDT